MRILIIGGTGLTGPHLVRELYARGHELTLYNRGLRKVPLPDGVRRLVGDKDELAGRRAELERLRADVVVRMVAYTADDAETFLRAFEGIAGRAVVISSCDVYLAYGRIHVTEPGPPQDLPLTEDSALRTRLGPDGEDYDKLSVERIVSASDSLPATIIRYPAVYGPGDRQLRFSTNLQPMLDGRRHIVLGESQSRYRMTHGYAEDVAHAVALATTDPRASGRIYNAGELVTPALRERIEEIGRVFGWEFDGSPGRIPSQGRMVTVPDEEVPDADIRASNLEQEWVLDTSRIREELGYTEVVSTEQGLRRTIDWLLANQDLWYEPLTDYVEEDVLLRKYGSGR